MFKATKVIDVELNRPFADIENLAGYRAVKALVRLHGTPLGYVEIPVTGDRCPAQEIGKAVLEAHSYAIIRHSLHNALSAQPDRLRLDTLFDTPPLPPTGPWPLVTVAVCTRNRTEALAQCLQGLSQLDYPNLEILVVDNAPDDDASERLVQEQFPGVRYVEEPRPGLDWARNRAIVEARGEIIAYTDDDVIVDAGWVKALAAVFVENPEVAAVTGLVVAHELETPAQVLFEKYGGFGRGFQRKWFHLPDDDSERWFYYGAGEYGTGANMAFRRAVFQQIGLFDPALDVGTVSNGGGDLEIFFRLLVEGHTLVYEPRALVRHRHRRDYEHLQQQIKNNGIGLYAYHMRSMRAYPRERLAFLKLGLYWLWKGNIRRLLGSFIQPARFPRELIWAELWGSLVGIGRYHQARRNAAEIAAQWGPFPELEIAEAPPSPPVPAALKPAAVRTVELAQPLSPLAGLEAYATVRVFVTWNGRPLGSVDIDNRGQPVGVSQLLDAIVDELGLSLLEPDKNLDADTLWAKAMTALAQRFGTAKETKTANDETIRLTAAVPVSVVVATHDRPYDLRECLRYLVAQASPRQVEIIVVDNNPSSGLTPPVVAEFPGVKLVTETRKGLSYARNTGITASSGDVVICTDDDVVMPPEWLENLVAPFARPDVMIVTGNTLPWELDTASQCFFEKYGGLGRGFERLEVNQEWFESFHFYAVPTWELGATANAAFRADIFSHPQIGLLDEALGAGSPTGCSEDTYIFYQVLRAGYTLVYEPAAYVWHKHRRDLKALRRQLYSYNKGGVAYHITTFTHNRDLRGLLQILVHLPIWHAGRIAHALKNLLLGRKNEYPLSLILVEIAGNLVGPWALWRSRRRVKRLGRSALYIPVSQRTAAEQALAVELPQPLAEAHQRTPVGIL